MAVGLGVRFYASAVGGSFCGGDSSIKGFGSPYLSGVGVSVETIDEVAGGDVISNPSISPQTKILGAFFRPASIKSPSS